MINNEQFTWGNGSKTSLSSYNDKCVPDTLDKDLRAQQLAKIALGWDEMTAEQKMDNTRALLKRAQEIKEAL